MSFEDRSNLVMILINLAMAVYFGFWILPEVFSGGYAGVDGLAHWAQAVLLIIPVAIVATIVLTILVTIGYAIATQNGKPSEVVDERDRAIGVLGLRINLVVAGVGFLLALIGLAFLGWTAIVVLNLTFLGFMAGGLAGDVTKFVLYRQG